MNEVIRQLAARRSVRAFEDRDIPGEVRAAILEAAAQAPTAGNQQLYTILDVTDPQLKARLAETCDHQPFIAQAPMVLIFLADVCKWLDAYREAGCEPRAPGGAGAGVRKARGGAQKTGPERGPETGRGRLPFMGGGPVSGGMGDARRETGDARIPDVGRAEAQRLPGAGVRA